MIYRSYVYCNTIKVNRPTNKLILKREKFKNSYYLSSCLIPSDYRDIIIICL